MMNGVNHCTAEKKNTKRTSHQCEITKGMKQALYIVSNGAPRILCLRGEPDKIIPILPYSDKVLAHLTQSNDSLPWLTRSLPDGEDWRRKQKTHSWRTYMTFCTIYTWQDPGSTSHNWPTRFSNSSRGCNTWPCCKSNYSPKRKMCKTIQTGPNDG